MQMNDSKLWETKRHLLSKLTLSWLLGPLGAQAVQSEAVMQRPGVNTAKLLKKKYTRQTVVISGCSAIKGPLETAICRMFHRLHVTSVSAAQN